MEVGWGDMTSKPLLLKAIPQLVGRDLSTKLQKQVMRITGYLAKTHTRKKKTGSKEAK